MKCYINPSMERFRSFIEQLPDRFEQGKLIFQGRNTIRSFEVAGERITVKRFRKPSGINALTYGHLRKSKARRAFEHATELCRLKIPTPEPIGWREDYRRGIIRDTYLITRYSDFKPISEMTNAFPAPHTLPVLEGMAAFIADLHRKGVEHGDFNNGNTQWKIDEAGRCHFEVIDINRMNFRGRELTRKESLYNLRRFNCPMTAHSYILGRYGELRGWDNYYSQMDGARQYSNFVVARDHRDRLKKLIRGKKK
ncbi:MAG: LPS kinase Kdo/WaaP [Alistipes sp.]|nr:LPS kinase Kdo/WaaP [Alistipes sp.]